MANKEEHLINKGSRRHQREINLLPTSEQFVVAPMKTSRDWARLLLRPADKERVLQQQRKSFFPGRKTGNILGGGRETFLGLRYFRANTCTKKRVFPRFSVAVKSPQTFFVESVNIWHLGKEKEPHGFSRFKVERGEKSLSLAHVGRAFGKLEIGDGLLTHSDVATEKVSLSPFEAQSVQYCLASSVYFFPPEKRSDRHFSVTSRHF